MERLRFKKERSPPPRLQASKAVELKGSPALAKDVALKGSQKKAKDPARRLSATPWSADRQKDRQSQRQRQRHRLRQRQRQTDSQADRQTGRDRQTGTVKGYVGPTKGRDSWTDYNTC